MDRQKLATSHSNRTKASSGTIGTDRGALKVTVIMNQLANDTIMDRTVMWIMKGTVVMVMVMMIIISGLSSALQLLFLYLCLPLSLSML